MRRHEVLHEGRLAELLAVHHVVLLAGVELVGVELLRDAALRVLPLFGHGIHADLLVGALLRVRHRAVHGGRFLVHHREQILHLGVGLVLVHLLRLHLLHDLALQQLELVLRDVAALALHLLRVLHRVKVHLVQRLLARLRRGVALPHLQLAHLIELLRGFAGLGDLEGLGLLGGGLLELELVLVGGHVLGLHLLEVVLADLVLEEAHRGLHAGVLLVLRLLELLLLIEEVVLVAIRFIVVHCLVFILFNSRSCEYLNQFFSPQLSLSANRWSNPENGWSKMT